jgi:hypothetical protein
VRLGEYFASKGIAFDAALTGTLQRHGSVHGCIGLVRAE